MQRFVFKLLNTSFTYKDLTNILKADALLNPGDSEVNKTQPQTLKILPPNRASELPGSLVSFKG